MARIKNILVDQAQGAIGKQIVFRTRGGKTFVSKFPDMSNIKPTAKQIAVRTVFGKASRHSSAALKTAKKNGTYKRKKRKGSSFFHEEMKDFLKGNK